MPEWVAYEIKRYDGDCIPTKKRPKWFPDDELESNGIAPDDDSYKYSNEWRKEHKNWYVRGHLAMKLLAERLGNDAGYNTHTFLNAVPQRNEFNRGIWLDLEKLTGAWAQKYGSVWVITGPVFYDKTPRAWIGEADKDEFQIAIPDALFKIVVKNSNNPKKPDVLAFVYSQEGKGYTKKPFKHEDYLKSIYYIEELTGLDFLTALDDEVEKSIESVVSDGVWEVEKEYFIGACKK